MGGVHGLLQGTIEDCRCHTCPTVRYEVRRLSIILWKEEFMDYFKVPSRHLSEIMQEITETLNRLSQTNR
jgi:hypothetical protein